MENKGFLASLFDMSFTEFITTRIIKALYTLAIFLSAIAVVLMVYEGFSFNFLTGLGTLILAPLAFLLYVVLTRIWLELVIVIFRIAENTSRMVERQNPPQADQFE